MLLGDSPFIEGVYVNRLNNKYYLQYACPGTEYPTYSDCVYVADRIDGDYKFQRHNPYSIVPSGFVTGAGHGSTIADKYGNLWHASSVGICVNYSFERRIGLWCAGIDKDGILYCNQEFSDYPKEIPEDKFNPSDIKPKWMLLSYRADVSASSSTENHPPENAIDESIKTCWQSATGKAGEWLKVDLGESKKIGCIQLNFADVDTEKLKLPRKKYNGTPTLERYIDTSCLNKTQWILYGSNDNQKWDIIADKSNADTDLPHDYVLVYEDTRVDITFLNAEVENYYFCIDAFNENGITRAAYICDM